MQGLGNMLINVCINKTVITVYIEKSHPNIYAIMAILLPNIQFNYDYKIPSTIRVGILTPRISYSNGGPCKSKNDTEGVPCASKSDTKWS